MSQRAIAEAWPAGPEDCFKYKEAPANGVEDGSAGDCNASSDDPPSVTTSSAAEADPSIVQALATNDDEVIAKIISQGDRYHSRQKLAQSNLTATSAVSSQYLTQYDKRGLP